MNIFWGRQALGCHGLYDALLLSALHEGMITLLVYLSSYKIFFLRSIVGVIGAVLAGFLLTPLFGVSTINQNNFSLQALLVSLLGAIVLLAIVNLLRRGTVR